MDPISLLIAVVLGAPVVTEDDLTLPDGCRPAQVVWALQAHVGPVTHVDEVIVGYANGLGQLEFSARAAGGPGHGKGAMDCATGQIVAFGIGPELRNEARLCPPARTHATVACVRHWPRPPAQLASRARATTARRAFARLASARRHATAR